MYKRVTLYSAFLVLALALSYFESLIPPIIFVPGIKLGFANLAVLYLIYKNDYVGAILVNLARIILSCLLFSGFNTFIYSVLGAALSLIIMCVFKKIKAFSIIGVSCVGAVFHNIGQLLASLLFMPITVFYYLPVLVITGLIAGFVMGIICKILLERIREV